MARYWQLLVKASGDTKRANKSMRDLKKASRDLKNAVGVDFGQIAKGSALALGAGLAASVKVGVDEMLEAQRVTAQTNAVIKSTGGAANVSAQGLAKLAGALSNVSGVDDELIQSGANVLLTFTNVRNAAGKNNDIFDQATRVALDMSTALGQDLKSSNIQLGKALNDPIKGITALSRVGVSFTKEQKNMIDEMMDAGNVMGAQKIILAELNKEFGGSAAAAGGTAQGAINRLKNSYAELSATIVQAVFPSLAGVADRLAKLVARVQEWAATKGGQEALASLRSALQQAGSAIGVVASSIGKLIGFLYRWRDVLVPVTAGILAAVAAMKAYRIALAAAAVVQAAFNVLLTANPVGVIVLAVVALVAALVVAYKRSEKFRAIVNTVIDAFKRLGRFAVQVFQSLRARMQPVINIIRTIGTVYIKGVILYFRLLATVAGVVWNSIRAAWGRAVGLFNRVKNALNFSSAFSSLKEGFRDALNGIIRLWNNLEFGIPGLPGRFKKYFDGVKISTPNIPYLAEGGTIRRPGTVLVGEAGPEYLTLPRGARVTPLDKAGGNTYNVTVNASQPVDTVAFMRSLRTAARMGTV